MGSFWNGMLTATVDVSVVDATSGVIVIVVTTVAVVVVKAVGCGAVTVCVLEAVLVMVFVVSTATRPVQPTAVGKTAGEHVAFFPLLKVSLYLGTARATTSSSALASMGFPAIARRFFCELGIDVSMGTKPADPWIVVVPAVTVVVVRNVVVVSMVVVALLVSVNELVNMVVNVDVDCGSVSVVYCEFSVTKP